MISTNKGKPCYDFPGKSNIFYEITFFPIATKVIFRSNVWHKTIIGCLLRDFMKMLIFNFGKSFSRYSSGRESNNNVNLFD